jgi:hypothetical protein
LVGWSSDDYIENSKHRVDRPGANPTPGDRTLLSNHLNNGDLARQALTSFNVPRVT